jgi:glycosyltransferase involved in cell wall biosynthesis
VNGIAEENSANQLSEIAIHQLFNRLRRAQRERASRIITVSGGIQKYLHEENPAYNITVISNGVDIDHFDVESKVSENPPYQICYVGGLQEWQGVEMMIKVVDQVQTEVEFTIVGGTKERCSELRQLVRGRNVGSSVEIVGRVPHHNVPNYINRADLCFGPFVESRNASPLKMFEYVSCGREVIYVNKHGLDLDSIPGVHRLEYSSNPKDIARGTDKIIANTKMNYAGRKYIMDNHSWEAVTHSVINECEEVVEPLK